MAGLFLQTDVRALCQQIHGREISYLGVRRVFTRLVAKRSGDDMEIVLATHGVCSNGVRTIVDAYFRQAVLL